MDWNDYISQVEGQHDLTPGVLRKLIEVESGGWTGAKSPAGAIGLTQLMPDTAKELGVDPTDPAQNILGGAKYLRKNLDKFNGDYAQAIAAYNAGPNHPAVVKKDWNKLPEETKKYTQHFLEFIKPAQADNSPKASEFKPIEEKPQEVQPEQAAKPNETSALDAALYGGANWATGNFMDELIGGACGLGTMLVDPEARKKGFEANYKQARDLYRNLTDKAFDEHPIAYGTGAIAGGALSPINKLTKGMGIMGSGATYGAISGAGGANELEDVPKDTLVGAGVGAVGAPVIKYGLDKTLVNPLKAKVDNLLLDTTKQEVNKASKKLFDVISGRTSEGGITNERLMDKVISDSQDAVGKAYTNLEGVAQNIDNTIPISNTQKAVNEVLNLDNSAFNEVQRNANVASAIDKISRGEQLTAQEAVSLHKHLTRITNIDGETNYALKNAQEALGKDIIGSGNPDLTSALKDASTTYAKDKTIHSLHLAITKALDQTEAGQEVNYKRLITQLKNWRLSTRNDKNLKFNPGLKEAITKIESVVNSHPQLWTQPKVDNSSLVGKVFGNNFMDIVGKNLGGIAGGAIGGPAGAVAGELAQLGLRGTYHLGKAGVNKGLDEAITRFYAPRYRAAIQKALTQTAQPVDNSAINSLSSQLSELINNLNSGNQNR